MYALYPSGLTLCLSLIRPANHFAPLLPKCTACSHNGDVVYLVFALLPRWSERARYEARTATYSDAVFKDRVSRHLQAFVLRVAFEYGRQRERRVARGDEFESAEVRKKGCLQVDSLRFQHADVRRRGLYCYWPVLAKFIANTDRGISCRCCCHKCRCFFGVF